MIINKSGITIRTSVSSIKVSGRATQGVKLISLREGDSIASVCTVAHEDEEPAAAATEQISADGTVVDSTEPKANENNN